MATRTWVGGGTNNVYDANNWSPAGAPQPGDGLFVESGTANMRGGNLAGDTLNLGALTSYTTPPPATVNLRDGADLTARVFTAGFTNSNDVFNITGQDTVQLTIIGQYYGETTVTENIACHSTLHGTFTAQGNNYSLTIQGADKGARFDNDGASTIAGGVATINAAVVGTGTISAGLHSDITFMSSVGRGQIVNSQGSDTVVIDDPRQFHGLVDFLGGPQNNIDLQGIVNADSYTYHNDMLALLQNGNVVDRLRFNAEGNAFQVTESSSGAQISSTIYSPENPAPAGVVILSQIA